MKYIQVVLTNFGQQVHLLFKFDMVLVIGNE